MRTRHHFDYGGRKRLDRYVPHTDGWGAYQLRDPWRCRECGRRQQRTDIAWYTLDIGPFCTRCRNAAFERANATNG